MRLRDVPQADLDNFTVVERVASCLSLIGIAFIVLTFLVSPAFHNKPINRLVFYASIGNILTNTATVMSRSYMDNHNLCQFQAFLIQMFMPADAFWTFAMACNVWLTFYMKFDAARLRKLEKWYFVGCYGVPFVVAASFLGVKTKEKGPMYGNATLWCWIAGGWDEYRIGLFYAPVWFIVILTFIIYLRAGKDIWVKRKQLRRFSFPEPEPGPGFTDPFRGEGIQQTTDISINYEDITPADSDQGTPGKIRFPAQVAKQGNTFTVDISSNQLNNSRWSYVDKEDGKVSVTESVIPISTPKPSDGLPPRKYSTMEANSAIWSYTKVSLLFFVAMMITWIPSSANRAYSTVHKGHVALPLQYAAACVLPLQGFWNAIIYGMTSRKECKDLFYRMIGRKPWNSGALKGGPFDEENGGHHRGERLRSSHANNHNNGTFFMEESDSLTELRTSRPTTQGSTKK